MSPLVFGACAMVARATSKSTKIVCDVLVRNALPLHVPINLDLRTADLERSDRQNPLSAVMEVHRQALAREIVICPVAAPAAEQTVDRQRISPRTPGDEGCEQQHDQAAECRAARRRHDVPPWPRTRSAAHRARGGQACGVAGSASAALSSLPVWRSGGPA